MAKEILAKTPLLTVPAVYWKPDTGYMLYRQTNVEFKDVHVEKHLGDIVPDILLKTSRGQELIVEIAVTHKVTQTKIHRIIARQVSALEIHLPRAAILDFDLVRSALLTSRAQSFWIYNTKAGEFRRQVFSGRGDGSHRTYVLCSQYYAYFPVETFGKRIGPE
ncbi:MAG: hypothetical protein ACTHLW_09965 [Verrucomicrobiota bacterium]